MLNTCSKCGKVQKVQLLKKFLRKNGKAADSYYLDENGHKFPGNICYECREERRRIVQKKICEERRAKFNARTANRRSLKEKATTRVCCECGVLRPVKFIARKPHRRGVLFSYLDIISEKIWITGPCPPCAIDKNNKKRGYSKRSESTRPQTIMAVKAEEAAAKFMESLGFEINGITSVNGPDIICSIGHLTYTVEVKRAGYSARRWYVSKVRPKRINDDLVAMVLPNGRVYLDDMKTHLSKCAKDLSRSITGIVKEFGLN